MEDGDRELGDQAPLWFCPALSQALLAAPRAYHQGAGLQHPCLTVSCSSFSPVYLCDRAFLTKITTRTQSTNKTARVGHLTIHSIPSTVAYLISSGMPSMPMPL